MRFVGGAIAPVAAPQAVSLPPNLHCRSCPGCRSLVRKDCNRFGELIGAKRLKSLHYFLSFWTPRNYYILEQHTREKSFAAYGKFPGHYGTSPHAHIGARISAAPEWSRESQLDYPLSGLKAGDSNAKRQAGSGLCSATV